LPCARLRFILPPVTFAATIALLFLIGYASQRSGVCMVRAVREVIERRRLHRLAGFALAAASAMLVMGWADFLGASPFTTISGSAPDLLAAVGGILFGLGSLLAGHCATGLLASLTRGELWRAASIATMVVATLLLGPHMSSAALMLPEREAVTSPLAGHPALALAIGGALAVVAARYIHRRIGWHAPRGGCSPLVAMSLVGAASGILFALDRRWVYTSRIADIAYGRMIPPGAMLGLSVLVIGMVSASIAGGSFRFALGTWRNWTRATAGGLLMGIGATLVPGGNDAMLFTGVPLLLPNLLAGYTAFIVTLFAALMLRRRGTTDEA